MGVHFDIIPILNANNVFEEANTENDDHITTQPNRNEPKWKFVVFTTTN